MSGAWLGGLRGLAPEFAYFLRDVGLASENDTMISRLALLIACLLVALASSSCRESPEASHAEAQAPAGSAATTMATSAALLPSAGESSEADPPVLGADARFLSEEDSERRRSLGVEPIVSVEKGSGGRSLGFRVTLADGTRGYFKPEQSFSAAHWYSEVAAYYLDRELGLGRVPPVVGRRMEWAQLRRAARRDPRVAEVEVADDGSVRGAFVWWVPEGLRALRMGHSWEHWIRVQSGIGISPFQRPSHYQRARRGEEIPMDGHDRGRARSPDIADRPAELSDMIVFDYLTQNVDRWGGDFTNVRTRGRGGPLVFLDNGAGFWLGEQRNELMERRLHALQRFRGSTVEAVRGFDRARFEERLASDALAPILNERQLDGLVERIGALLEHVEAMQARFGDAAVPW